MAAGVVRAQQQEQGLTQRMSAQPNMQQVNPMQNQAYAAGAYGTKTFAANNYAGVKDASTRTYETRSFLGIKNPWFGRKVFATDDNRLAKRSAREGGETFATETYAVREFGRSRPATENTQPVAAAAAPRPYLVPGKTQGALDRFTENLQKDLTVDDVRELLNKGRSN